jgi:hypothetical protein
MKNDNSNGRRNFLKTTGAVMLSAAVPNALLATKASAQNNLRQMIVFGGVSEPNPLLPGIYGMVGFHLTMCADIGGRSGVGSISDPVVTEINSHILFQSGRRDLNDLYIFQGNVARSNSSELMGKTVIVKVQLFEGDNCNVHLTIVGTPVDSVELPAVQRIRTRLS